MTETVVFLPGMMCDARLFSDQIAALSVDRTVCAAPITMADSIEAISHGLLEVLPSRFALAGLSMGGIVAMEMLRQAPERISRIALMDTNPLAELPNVAKAREPQIKAVEDGNLLGVMRDEMKPNYLAPGDRRSDVMDLVLSMAQALGPKVFVRQSRALQSRPAQIETLRMCKVPALLLCGRHDALCPVSRHEMMADLIPHAELVVLEKSGHLPTLEQPQETIAVLKRWLS